MGMLFKGTEVMGRFCVKEKTIEGKMVVDFAKRIEMAVVNSYLQKREDHRVTCVRAEARTYRWTAFCVDNI